MSSARKAISFRVVPVEWKVASSPHDDGSVREELARMRAALDLSSDAVLFLAPRSLAILDANSAACASLGLSRCELLSMTWSEFASGISRSEATAAIAAVAMGQTLQTTLSIEHLHRRGFSFPVEARLRRAGSETSPVLVAVVQDLSERRRLETLARHDAFHDALTGLPNRALMECRLQQAIEAATRGTSPFAVIFIDLDGFKEVNDSLGHLAGDRLLKIAAQRLSASVRPGDLVARFGGDEFVVLLQNVGNLSEATAIVERITHEMDAPVVLNGRALVLSASVGVAVRSDGHGTVEDILDAADRAMYRQKRTSRMAVVPPAEISDRESPVPTCLVFPGKPR